MVKRGCLLLTHPATGGGSGFFVEMPLHLDEIDALLARVDQFVAIGTSGSVYPAAGFVQEARLAGARTCELNLAPSANAALFDERYYGNATEVVPDWADRVIARSS